MTDCILSSFSLDSDGYVVKYDPEGGSRRLARNLYERANGKLKRGIVIDHLCRNRACININHLEAVTIAENTRRGKTAKITMSDAVKIRELYKMKNLKQIQLAKIFNIGQDQISRIINERRWA